jgi:hypothetical protein
MGKTKQLQAERQPAKQDEAGRTHHAGTDFGH